MLVSTKGRYALRLMMDVALNCGNSPVPLKDVSERQGLSIKYLEQLVRPLASAGLLESIRGQHGGYILGANPADISTGDILRAAEGDVAPIYCLEEGAEECPRANKCATLGFWQGLDSVINEYIDNYTLEKLITSTCFTLLDE